MQGENIEKHKIFNEKSLMRLLLTFRRNVLEKYRSDGLDMMGPIKPSLALCVFGVFVLVYFSLWKGVKSAGKVN